jgi:hypothetical protein
MAIMADSICGTSGRPFADRKVVNSIMTPNPAVRTWLVAEVRYNKPEATPLAGDVSLFQKYHPA